jgi:hypothetical protein
MNEGNGGGTRVGALLGGVEPGLDFSRIILIVIMCKYNPL